MTWPMTLTFLSAGILSTLSIRTIMIITQLSDNSRKI